MRVFSRVFLCLAIALAAAPLIAAGLPQGYSIGLVRDGELVETLQHVGVADFTPPSGARKLSSAQASPSSLPHGVVPSITLATAERNAALSRAAEAGDQLKEFVRQSAPARGRSRRVANPEFQRLTAAFFATQARARETLIALRSDLERRGVPAVILERHEETLRRHDERMEAFQQALAEDARAGAMGDSLKSLLQDSTFLRRPVILPTPTIQARKLTAPRLSREDADVRIGARNAALLSMDTRPAMGQGRERKQIALESPPGVLDLVATPDVQFTLAISNRAAALGHSALAIYDWVRNNVEFEPYLGSRKGADFTLRQLRGNDADQASLLVALLRVSGIPARYARGTIELSPRQALELTGVDDVETASSLLTTAGLDGVTIFDGSEVAAVRCTRVWVEAYVPYSNYRGAVLDDTGRTWIPLDPGFKAWTVTPGADVLPAMGWNIDDFLAAYIGTVHALSPLEQLSANIQTWLDIHRPGSTVTDIERQLGITPQRLGLLPASLPYQVINAEGSFSELTEADRYKVRFHLHGEDGTFIDHTLRLVDLAGHRLTIEYVGATSADQAVIDSFGTLYDTPPNLVNVRPLLKLDNVPIAAAALGVGIGMGRSHSSDMQFIAPAGANNEQPMVSNEILAGNSQAIAFDTFLDVPELPSDSSAQEADVLIEAVLHPTAKGYLSRVSEGFASAARLLHIVSIQDVSEAIVESAIKVTYSGSGTPLTFEWSGLIVDADRRIVGPFSVNGDESREVPFMKLTGYEGSTMEHRIFEDSFNQEAVSTIKILQLANDAGIGVCNILSSIAADCPGFAQSATVTTSVNTALAQGHHVTIPRAPITVQQWSGTGYIDLDPATGAGAYIISGGINGNVSVSGGATVATWDIHFTCAFTSIAGTVTVPSADSPDPSAIYSGTDTTPLELEGTVTVTCPDGNSQTTSLKPPFALPSPKAIVDNPLFGPGDYQVTLFALGQTKILRKLTITDLEVEIFKPKVLDPSQSLIPREERATRGAQTFVNHDNDDNDSKFDDTDDAVAGGDDELVKIRLRLRPATLPTGTLKLLAPTGAADIKVWKQNDKATASSYALGSVLNLPADVSVEGDALVAELWVEGITAHTSAKGTMLDAEFAIGGKLCKPQDRSALTILGLDRIEWVGRSNSRTDGNALDADPNWPGALVPGAFRVFPDARSSGGALLDKVDIKVTLTVAPIEKVPVFFKPFDVDDPADAAAPIDDDTATGQADDNRGISPAKAGKITGADATGVATVEFTGATATFEFQTTAQPGDNFRIAGNGDRDSFGALENDDRAAGDSQDDKARIVDRHVTGSAAQKEIRQSDKYSSPVLSVWRFLHVEKDSMVAVPPTANILTTRLTDFTGTASAATRLKIANALNDGSPDLDDVPAGNGRFEKGSARIAVGAFVVTPLAGNDNDEIVHAAQGIVPLNFHAEDNDVLFNGTLDGTITAITRSAGSFVLTLNITAQSETPIDWPDFIGGIIQMGGGPDVAITAVNASNSTVTVSTLSVPTELADDDSRTVLPQVGDISHLVTVLREVYIEVLDDGGGNVANNTQTAAFLANLPGSSSAADEASFVRQAIGTDAFWVGYLLMSHQFTTSSDTDPDSEAGTGGVAWAITSNTAVAAGGRGTQVFAETIRDRLTNTGALAGLGQRVTAHEIGHQLGLDHWDTGEAGVPGGAVPSNLMLRSMQSTPNASAFLAPMHKHIIRSRVKSPGT